MNYYLITIIFVVIIFLLFIACKKYSVFENFTTPNFVQIYNKSGSSPHTALFLPIYRNETAFNIYFGDGMSKRISNVVNSDYVDERFYHTYVNKGTYNGYITFDKSDVKQTFEINVL